MDGTKRIETGEAEAEFSRQYEEISKELDIQSILRACRDRAIFLTIDRFSKYLDQVRAQKPKDGRIELNYLAYQIFPDLFVDLQLKLFLKPIIEFGVALIVNPAPEIDAQLLQSILRELSLKAKAGVLGKRVLSEQ